MFIVFLLILNILFYLFCVCLFLFLFDVSCSYSGYAFLILIFNQFEKNSKLQNTDLKFSFCFVLLLYIFWPFRTAYAFQSGAKIMLKLYNYILLNSESLCKLKLSIQHMPFILLCLMLYYRWQFCIDPWQLVVFMKFEEQLCNFMSRYRFIFNVSIVVQLWYRSCLNGTMIYYSSTFFY